MQRSVLGAGGYDEPTWRLVGISFYPFSPFQKLFLAPILPFSLPIFVSLKCVPRSVLRVGGYDETTWRLLGNGPRSGGEGHQICLLAGEGG